MPVVVGVVVDLVEGVAAVVRLRVRWSVRSKSAAFLLLLLRYFATLARTRSEGRINRPHVVFSSSSPPPTPPNAAAAVGGAAGVADRVACLF